MRNYLFSAVTDPIVRPLSFCPKHHSKFPLIYQQLNNHRWGVLLLCFVLALVLSLYGELALAAEPIDHAAITKNDGAHRMAVSTSLGATTCALTLEIINAPYAVVDSNKPGDQGPKIATLGARLRNNGTSPITALQLHIGDGIAPGSFTEIQGEALELHANNPATYQLPTIAPGEERAFFWSVTYPFSDGISYPYTIWAESAADCLVIESSQLTTQREISASANLLLPTGSILQIFPESAVPGAQLTVRITGFTLGTIGKGPNTAYDAWLQPVGNPDYDPTCLRLIHSEVMLHSVWTTPLCGSTLLYRPPKLSFG